MIEGERLEKSLGAQPGPAAEQVVELGRATRRPPPCPRPPAAPANDRGYGRWHAAQTATVGPARGGQLTRLRGGCGGEAQPAFLRRKGESLGHGWLQPPLQLSARPRPFASVYSFPRPRRAALRLASAAESALRNFPSRRPEKVRDRELAGRATPGTADSGRIPRASHDEPDPHRVERPFGDSPRW